MDQVSGGALHVGDGSLPTLDLPDLPDCTFEVVRESGEVVEEIERAAREREVGLIVMATEGTTESSTRCGAA